MKLISCAALVLAGLVTVPSVAQENASDSDPEVAAAAEPEIALLTKFELPDNPAIEKRITELLKKYVSVFNRSAEALTLAELRLKRFSVRKEIAGIVATEGYFSPVISFDIQAAKDKRTVKIKLELGPVTKVASAQINFSGDAVPVALQQSIQSHWGLPKDAVFRDDDWTRAKNNALDSLTDKSFAAAKISASQALIQDQLANLSVDIDSGPVFHFGDLQLNGLHRYKPWLVDRYHPPEKGDIYNRAKLLKFQRDLQNSPYFSSVTVNVDPDPALAAAVPVEVLISERQEYDVGLGAGYSTNTGARGEVSFQDRDFLNDAYDLKSVIRIEQLQQIGYVDVYLPPHMDGYLDSVGVLVNRSDISGLVTSTSSFGAKRVVTENDIERRLGLSYTYEESTVSGGPEVLAKALVSSIGWTRRKVDSAFAPRQGYIAQLDIGAAAKAVLSDQNFIRLYGKIQYWTPVGSRDVLILRAESGYVIAPSSDGIPEDYLFRAGGTASVRGYSYQSLGVNQNDGVVGGRALATGTVEYVHWVGESWGLAAFVDEGDAAENFKVLRMEQGIGGGVRIKTPAGPIAIDLGYGREVQKFRLDFSVGIAF